MTPIKPDGSNAENVGASATSAAPSTELTNKDYVNQQTTAWTAPWKKDEMAFNMGLQQREWAREDAIRQWEQEQANHAMQTKIQDLKNAGLNPWLALQGNALGTGTEVAQMQTSSASPRMHSDTGTTIGAMLGVITALLGMGISAKVKSANTNQIFKNMLKINNDRADLALLSKYKFHEYKKHH